MPKDSSASDAVPVNKTVLAAGAVLWRASDDGDEPEVAVIHRPRYDDWSLPKGKVDAGENEPMTAVREVHEETGYSSRLGRRLASVSYSVETQGIKKVRYWAARIVDGEFTPNNEVDELKWLPVSAAIKQLQYARRPEGVTPVREVSRRHQDHLDRPTRHRGQQVAVQGRRPFAPLGQTRPRSSRIIGRPTDRVRRGHPLCGRSGPLPPDPRATGRRTRRRKSTTNRC